ncbi:MAG: PQQ-binding-like beta-propeller repeat protein [Caldisericia bacterium]|nr:PQQ-binding-like beta-propeller repeat protein [Caldisericia bacterium]
MRKLLILTTAFVMMATLFAGLPPNTANAASCNGTRKGNNTRDGSCAGTEINGPALIQTWIYEDTANISTPPVACGNRIYQALNSRRVVCIEKYTGTELWEFKDITNFPVSSMAIDQETQSLVVTTGGQIERTSTLYCFDATSGNLRWQWTAGTDGAIGQISTGATIINQPGITQMVIFGVDRGALIALDLKSGARVWGVGLNGALYTDPVIADNKVFALNDDGLLNIVRLENGTTLQQVQIDEKQTYEFYNTPAYSAGILVIASRSKISGQKGRIYGLDTATGTVIWKSFEIDQFYKSGPSILKPPVYSDYQVIIGSDTGMLYNFDLKTGRMRWSLKMVFPFLTDIMISGKYILFGGANTFYVCKGENGDVVFKQTLSNVITGHPVVDEGMVYVPANDGNLYAFSDHDDFTIDVLPRSDSIYPGNMRSYKVTISATMNFSYPMVLKATGLPNNVTATFAKSTVKPGLETVEVDLILEASSDAKPGTYACSIAGTLLGRERNAILQLQILEPLKGEFKLTVSSDQMTPLRNINPGDTIPFMIKVEAIGGFNAEITFFANPKTLPSGMEVLFNPTKLTPDGYVTAIVKTDTSTEADSYGVEIQGHAGGKVASTAVRFSVGGVDTESWPMFQKDIVRNGRTKEPFFSDPQLRADKVFKVENDAEAVVRIRTQPIVEFGMVYVIGEWESKENKRIHESRLYALDSKTLDEVWHFDFMKSVFEVDNFDDCEDKQWPVMSTPAVDTEDGLLYVGSLDGVFYCLDAKTGSRVWSNNTKRIIRTSPLILAPPEVAKKTVYFSTLEGTVHAMAAGRDANATVLKTFVAPSKVVSGFSYALNKKSPQQPMVMFSCFDGNIYALNANDLSKVYTVSIYNEKNIGTIAVDNDRQEWWVASVQGDVGTCFQSSMVERHYIQDGNLGCQRATFGPTFGSPALLTLSDSTVCFFATNFGVTPQTTVPTYRYMRLKNDGCTTVTDLVVEKGQWNCDGEQCVKNDWNYGSVIIDKNANAIVLNKEGLAFCYDANGKVVFKIETGHKTKAHPTFARRMLYIPSEDGHLFAYAAKWGFGLAPETGSPIVCKGQEYSMKVQFISQIPLKVPVKFSVVQAPSDCTMKFVPETLSASGETSLSIYVGPGCPEGTHPIIIKAEGSGLLRQSMISLVVREPSNGDFVFQANPNDVRIYAGESAEYSLTIDTAGGFINAVSMSVQGLPTGVTGAFAPIITTTPGKSKFKLNVARNTSPGEYNLLFKAEGGCKVHTYPVKLIVDPPVVGDYNCNLVNTDDRDIIMWLGESKEIPINCQYIDGYSLPVGLEVLNIGDFPGVTFTFTPTTVTSPGIVSLVVKTDFFGQTIDGKRVTIVTSSGRKTPKTQVSFILTVKKEQGSFSISPKQGTINVTAGQMAMAIFELSMSTNFKASVNFSLGTKDGCPGVTAQFTPAKLMPSVHDQRAVCLITIPSTFLDNDQAALQRGYKECYIQAVGIGGGMRVASREILMKVYKPDTNQIMRWMPEYKGLKNKTEDTIDIEIGNLENTCSVEFDLVYNPSYIEVVDVTEGPLMSTDLKKTTFVRTIDPELGIVSVSCIRQQGAGPISGTGKFCTVKVKAKQVTQETKLSIANIRIFDCNNGYKAIKSVTMGEPMVKLTISGFLPGDVDQDGKVDATDLMLLGKTFGLSAGDPGYDGRADFNDDKVVDGMDLIILCLNYGATADGDKVTP